jgi:hypothetical protein
MALLGRSKSLRFKNNRKEPSPELDVSEPRTTVERDGNAPHKNRDARVAPSLATGRENNPSMENIVRPKTAGGVAPSSRIKAHIPVTAADDSNLFPTSVSRPFAYSNSPATSSINLRSDTPDTIGLAIGSPSEAPPTVIDNFPSPANAQLLSPPTNGKRTPSPNLISNTPATQRASETRETNPEKSKDQAEMNDAAKPKLSRWKSLFGGGRKPSPANDQKSNYLPLSQQLSPDYGNWSGASYTSVATAHTPPWSSKKQKGKPGVKRAATLPTSPMRPDRGSPAPPPKDGAFLDVEIPDVQLERYSVMFKGLLPGQRVSRQPSNLLARRQANTEKANSLKVRTTVRPISRVN